jgi:2-oxoglutarate ferredoxin oxidoreductase subunit alpha
MTDCRILITGAAGLGVQTVGSMLTRLAAESGYSVFSWQDNESRIRGGSNAFGLRISDSVRNAPVDTVDVLLPLDEASRVKYRLSLKKDGVVVGPSDPDYRSVVVDFASGSARGTGANRFFNTAALGAAAAVLGFRADLTAGVVSREFSGKPEDLVAHNVAAAEEGYKLAAAQCREPRLESGSGRNGRAYVISGSDAVALGAWAAGCRFMAAYPMSPSTAVITTLSRHSRALGVFTEQAEDEIAAVNMAIGASYAGMRAMTATSGGGFALMTEAVSLAGMTETPLVIVLAQRPGPATGLPTRTEQGDLLFAVHSGHGEFPKAVLAPFDAKSAFHAMVRAFDLAEEFQTPVLVLTDQLLMDSAYTVHDFELDRIRNRHHVIDARAADPYRRYALTDSGISPRLPAGIGPHLALCDSDEHDEEGHITENPELRNRMVLKRLKKSEALTAGMAPPETVRIEDADVCFVSWGTTRNAAAEALERHRTAGRKYGLIHFSEVWPLPGFRFPAGKRFIAVEGNASGQFESMARAGYGITFEKSVRRFDGLPLDAEFIFRASA